MTENIKETLQNDINHLIGLMITLRTVETSPQHTAHWTNYFIDELSNIRNQMILEEDVCVYCHGVGEFSFARGLEPELCYECNGNGFTSKDKFLSLLRDIFLYKSSAINLFISKLTYFQ